jgi:hypothetical protein
VFFIDPSEVMVFFGTVVFMALLILPLMYFSYYDLREDHLFIQMSFIRMKLYYKDITEIREGRFSASSNMALSIDGVIIVRKGKVLGSVSISPEDKEMFMLELKRRCPKLNEDFDFGEDY